MFEILAKIVTSILETGVEVVMYLLVALLLSALFDALGAGQAGSLLGMVGAGVLAYSVHQHKKRKAASGLQRGTDVQAATVTEDKE